MITESHINEKEERTVAIPDTNLSITKKNAPVSGAPND